MKIIKSDIFVRCFSTTATQNITKKQNNYVRSRSNLPAKGIRKH